MNLLLAVVGLVTIVSLIAIRRRLRIKLNKLSEQIKALPSYNDKLNNEQTKDRKAALSDGAFVDIRTDLNNSFYGEIISARQESDFFNYYKPYSQEVYSLLKKLGTFIIEL